MSNGGSDATYEYNWNSLVGCLQSLLRQAGMPHDAARVSAVTGEAFRVPVAPGRSPETQSVSELGGNPASFGIGQSFEGLRDDLALLGLPARVDVWDLRGRRPTLLGLRVGRRVRRALAAGRAVVAYGAVEGEFGLLVGYDAARRGYRVQGALSEETGGWLRADRLPAPDANWLAMVIPEAGVERSEPAAMPALVERAVRRRIAAQPGDGLAAWAAWLRSEAEIEARQHARAAQALAAASGEAARFWRAASDAGVGAAAPFVGLGQELAVVLSRFATLFPFPMGGDVVGGGREAGARALASAIALEQRLDALMAALPPGGRDEHSAWRNSDESGLPPG